jgi:hypothetical protein
VILRQIVVSFVFDRLRRLSPIRSDPMAIHSKFKITLGVSRADEAPIYYKVRPSSSSYLASFQSNHLALGSFETERWRTIRQGEHTQTASERTIRLHFEHQAVGAFAVSVSCWLC